MLDPMRVSLRKTYPYLFVALSALAGAWFGFGMRTDYNIDEAVTAARIAQAYSSVLADMTAFYEHIDGGEREHLRARLRAALRADPSVVAAHIEVRPADAGRHMDFDYSETGLEAGACIMRSQQALRSGLIRCHYDHGRLDVVKFTRPIHQADDVTALAILELDYRKLRQRLREER
jgi:hypothetical protein